MSNKFVVVPATSSTAASVTQTTATLSDIFTSIFASDTFVDGAYKYLGYGLCVVGGMAAQNKKLTGSWNPFH